MMIDYLDRGVGAEAAAAMRAHLLGCETCRREVEEMRELLLAMGDQEMKQPGPGLRENFQLMLQSELNVEKADDLLRRGTGDKEKPVVAGKRIAWMAAAACILLAGGFWIGTMVSAGRGVNGAGGSVAAGAGMTAGSGPGAAGAGSGGTASTAELLLDMQKEIKEMKEELLYSLIDDESASQRIKAVNYVQEMSHPNEKMLGVLIHTLNRDKNVNVRLAALYSLSSFSDNVVVRDSLVASLPGQTEPVIQVMLINLLAQKKDTRAIAPIRDILSDKKTLPVVREAAQKGLKTL